MRGPAAIGITCPAGGDSLAGFGRDTAKQPVCRNHGGYGIGDGILFGLETEIDIRSTTDSQLVADNTSRFVGYSYFFDILVLMDK